MQESTAAGLSAVRIIPIEGLAASCLYMPQSSGTLRNGAMLTASWDAGGKQTQPTICLPAAGIMQTGLKTTALFGNKGATKQVSLDRHCSGRRVLAR